MFWLVWIFRASSSSRATACQECHCYTSRALSQSLVCAGVGRFHSFIRVHSPTGSTPHDARFNQQGGNEFLNARLTVEQCAVKNNDTLAAMVRATLNRNDDTGSALVRSVCCTPDSQYVLVSVRTHAPPPTTTTASHHMTTKATHTRGFVRWGAC